MKTIAHKFIDYKNKDNIKLLILGTFNPDTPNNSADFFYGRGRNYLWNLLPKVFEWKPLKNATLQEKKDFINKFNIGFVDIIQEIEVGIGQETNYKDNYIDGKVTKWLDIESFIENHQLLKKVFLTRKTFKDIPRIKKQIDLIKDICYRKDIEFYCLPSPARYENNKKLDEWISIIKN